MTILLSILRVALALVVALAIVGAAGCGDDEETPTGGGAGEEAQEPYRIGIFAPLSGFAAADGRSAVDSAQLAIDQVNEAGGIDGRKLELVVQDDASKPDQAASLAQKLAGDEDIAIGVSGSYSAQTRAAAPIFARNDKVMIAAYAVDPEITEVGEQIWRVGELASVQGRVAGELVTGNLRAQRIAILTVDNDYGAALTSAFREYVDQQGAEIVYESKFALDEDDFRTVLRNIEGRNPDVLFAPGYYNNAADIASQGEEIGLKAQLVGVEGYDSPKFLELAGDSANGVTFTTELNRDSDKEAVKDYMRAYERKTGREADAVGAETYDAVLLAVEALRQSASAETDALIEALQGIQAMESSVTEITGFSENRNAIRNGLAQVVRDGEFHFYAEFTDSELIQPE
jgi:branched-chain amino acid transport system substrate-binding protein